MKRKILICFVFVICVSLSGCVGIVDSIFDSSTDGIDKKIDMPEVEKEQKIEFEEKYYESNSSQEQTYSEQNVSIRNNKSTNSNSELYNISPLFKNHIKSVKNRGDFTTQLEIKHVQSHGEDRKILYQTEYNFKEEKGFQTILEEDVRYNEKYYTDFATHRLQKPGKNSSISEYDKSINKNTIKTDDVEYGKDSLDEVEFGPSSIDPYRNLGYTLIPVQDVKYKYQGVEKINNKNLSKYSVYNTSYIKNTLFQEEKDNTITIDGKKYDLSNTKEIANQDDSSSRIYENEDEDEEPERELVDVYIEVYFDKNNIIRYAEIKQLYKKGKKETLISYRFTVINVGDTNIEKPDWINDRK